MQNEQQKGQKRICKHLIINTLHTQFSKLNFDHPKHIYITASKLNFGKPKHICFASVR